MRPVTFCDRCRGMESGWNRKYIVHRLTCAPGTAFPYWLALIAVAVGALIVAFPTATTHEASGYTASSALGLPPTLTSAAPSVGDQADSPAVAAIEELLGRNARVDPENRSRIARAVVGSARDHDVDPFLVASILVVESGGDPFAISSSDAVGIMQIHVPTWGSVVDDEQISLFRIEDNIDLGTRILRDYTRRHGVWAGVRRYFGASDGSEAGDAYVRRVQEIYSDRLAD